MKISVITPVYNGESMIKQCMDSVAAQTYTDKEHIIVDGLSSDSTVAIVKTYWKEHIRLLSEKDKGLYDAFNKGISMADGDVVCFLCADDMYAHENVMEIIADIFQTHADVDMIYGDLVYVNREDLSKVARYWKSSPFRLGIFKKGWLAPHTALFIRKHLFSRYGTFNLKFKMASDYELQFRFFEKHKLKSLYVPGVMVRMRSGGVSNSSLKNMYKSLKECHDVLANQNVRFPLIYIFNTLLYRLKQTRIPSEIRRWNREQEI